MRSYERNTNRILKNLIVIAKIHKINKKRLSENNNY